MYATLQKSYDKTKWYPVDSVLIYGSGTSLKFKKDITAVNSFYYRLDVYGIDSTQKNKTELIILNQIQ